MDLDDEQALRLGRAVRAARQALRLSQHQVASAGGISVATLGRIERAESRVVEDGTLLGVDDGLQWQRGSAGRIIAGGDPVSADAPQVRVQEVPDDNGTVRRLIVDLPEDEMDHLRRRWERVWRGVEDDPTRAAAVIGAAEAVLEALASGAADP